MPLLIDIAGQTFGRLTVLDYIGRGRCMEALTNA